VIAQKEKKKEAKTEIATFGNVVTMYISQKKQTILAKNRHTKKRGQLTNPHDECSA
jgi:hypothetical protein